jgi:hypothetical protein
MNRKQRREAERRRKKKDPTQLMADKVRLFGEMPDGCTVCQKSFDRKDKEMSITWKVVQRKEVVRLFCPECIQKTQEVINEIAK